MLKIIRARLGSRGMIPFSEFMDLALYHPRHGYYSSSAERIGPEGDYYTSPHVHPIFGKLISRQLRQMWEILGFPSPFTIVEMGAGKGLLCADILRASRDTWPEFYRALVYMLAEISPALTEKQRSFLSSFEAEGKIEWVSPRHPSERKPAVLRVSPQQRADRRLSCASGPAGERIGSRKSMWPTRTADSRRSPALLPARSSRNISAYTELPWKRDSAPK